MLEKIEISIWGRNFTLPIEYDCYEGESVTDEQKKCVAHIQEKSECINKSLPFVRQHFEKSIDADALNCNKDNVFGYLAPHYLFVKREENPRMALMCRCKYEPEHGFAIVVTGSNDVELGIQDIIL